jgi:3(or 17)beta-hydroxysteroid dehydrogenase
MTRLHGKIALVTGARRGIGAGIVKAMTAEGALVFGADIERGAGSGGREVVLDVTREDDWSALAAQIQQEFGRLDILVNNAGIDMHQPAVQTSLQEWRQVMAVNLDGVFLGCKALHPLLVAAGRVREAGASVVNISSTLGIGAVPNELAYGTSKAGVRHLTKLLAIEWADPSSNIRVNSIHPGTIRTGMLEQAALGWALANTADRTLESGLKAVAAFNPMQRIGRIEDIAYAATFLASDEAAFITGTELVVDGGYLAR